MADFLIGIVLLIVVGAAVRYIVKAKKRGEKCIGCPYSGTCAQKSSSAGCSCGCQTDGR